MWNGSQYYLRRCSENTYPKIKRYVLLVYGVDLSHITHHTAKGTSCVAGAVFCNDSLQAPIKSADHRKWLKSRKHCVAQSTYTFSFELSSKHQQNIACGPQVEMERTTKVHLKTPFHTPQPIAWPSNSISSSGRFLVSGIQQASNKAQKAKKAKTRKEPKPRLSSKTWSICRLHQLQTKGLPWDSFKP